MGALIIIAVIIAAIWTPHIIAGITTRVRYWVRSHYGYTPKHTGASK